ncbi:tetratricopeptide repeat protein [Terriglobus sp. RCC_193]|uniref:tetratricopeptide repeat protein n=1 Tax=Terriglobus sp. RCC_193 TaxID=3239218 RepID=UPI0035265429
MDARSRDAAVAPLPSQVQTARRRLMLRDGLKFLTLTLVALLMSGVTTLLFRSFEAHREELAVRWAERGQQALAAGKPDQAVTALRTSLGFRSDVRENQLALAHALAASGRVDEAENYFVNLWQMQPGDGGINLELARLARQQGKSFNAIEYYRAAIFGTWSGDGPARRRDIRLELSSYLVELGQSKAARAELLIAAGNNPDASSQLRIGEALEAAGAPKEAATAYRNASEDKVFAATAQAKLGELCYAQGDYQCSAEELTQALRKPSWTAEQKLRMSTMQQNAERLQALMLSHDVASPLRAEHLLEAAQIAVTRVNGCLERHAGQADMLQLQVQWKALDTAKNRAALRHDDDVQDQYRTAIFNTERTAAAICGAPAGDDALLLYLADHPAKQFGGQP